MDAKEAAARRALEAVQDGMCLGLGSGTTVDRAIAALGERVREGLRVRLAVASRRSEEACRAAGLSPEPLDAFPNGLDRVLDGADEMDPDLNLIKGGGGALVREKLLIRAALEFVVIGAASKRVPVLGAFPLPVAIVPFGARATLRRLATYGAEPVLRMDGAQPFVSDDGLWIADIPLGRIEDPVSLEAAMKAETGVVEVGLFTRLAARAVIGFDDGRTEVVYPTNAPIG